MNKAELVDYVAEVTGAYKKDVKATVDAVLEGIEVGMKRDGKVTLVGFGNFIVKQRKARTARNPQTGKEIKIAAKKVVKFKPGSELADSVN